MGENEIELVELGLRRKIQFLVEAEWFQGAKGFHPEILSPEEGQTNLFLCHSSLVLDLFYDDKSEVSERVVFAAKVLVDFYRVLSLRIVSMLVDSSICLLGFQLTNILFAIEATVAPGEVNCIFGPTICFLANFELFSAEFGL